MKPHAQHQPSRLGVVRGVLTLSCVILGGIGCAEPAPVSFNEDIQPILSENCFNCHGRDESKRKAGLRLDDRTVAVRPVKSGESAVVPGDPDRSELLRRLLSSDQDEKMPPPDLHKTITPGQIDTLRRWISQGAKYEPHWAFVAPVKPVVPMPAPQAEQKECIANPIDAFVIARLEKEGLSPSPMADPYALIRRVTFDLTGLPPTPDEVARFVAESAAEEASQSAVGSSKSSAYGRLVDRLLASERYGEHRARYWLDAARYGDTTGLHRDNFRLSWPYRDYVIAAFNDNKPFDRFTVEQLAGDLIPAQDFAPLVATGFNRLHITTSESGEITEELQLHNVTDRVSTVSTVFLGLTSACASCHDHKFDPLSQKEFYALSAFFNNSIDPPFDDEAATYFPTVTLPPDGKRNEAAVILKERAAVQTKLDARLARADLAEKWIVAAKTTPVSTDKLIARFRFDEGSGDVVHNTAPGASPSAFTFDKLAPIWDEMWKLWPSMRFAAPSELRLGQLGDFEKTDAFTVTGWFKPRVGRTNKKGALVSKMSLAEKNRGWDLYWDDGTSEDTPKFQRWPEGRLMVELVSGGGNAIAVRAPKIVSRIDWAHLAFSYDGSGKAEGVRLFINGERQPVEVVRDRLNGSIRTEAPLQLGRRTEGEESKPDPNPMYETAYQDLRIYARQLGDDEVRRTMDEDFVHELLARPHDSWDVNQRALVKDFFFRRIDAEAIALREVKAGLDAQLEQATKGGVQAFVMRDRDSLPMGHVLERGEFRKMKERVSADVPAFLPPLPAGVRHDRLALARWMVSAENPLVARVTVNRMWQELFGSGLVTTLGDFGVVGARPSNFALLDWLAVDFREHGWDVKRFYKQVVMSATYRQSAKATPALVERDPSNRLLARGPRFRLDGEMIRDEALAACGLLQEKIGGPSVNIYQPPGMWEALSMDGSNTRTHEADKGEGLYRRSLYTFWKRTCAPPVFATFDAPLREVCIAQRERTDTPLQALVMLNAPDFLEAARHLAAHAMKQPSTDERIDFMASRLLTRPLAAKDREVLRKAIGRFRQDFTEAEAREFLQNGDSPLDASLPVIEWASWTAVASQLLNTDQALNK